MKLQFSIWLLVVFAIRLFLNLGHELYYQWNKDFIADAYCVNKEIPESTCNGKCHLVKELKKVAEEEQNDLIPNKSQKTKVIEIWDVKTVEPIAFQASSFNVNEHQFHYQTPITEAHLLKLIKPPSVC